MTVTCPNCSKRYRLDINKLSPSRKVRCKACGHVWSLDSDKGTAPKIGRRCACAAPCQNKCSKKNCLLKVIKFFIWVVVFCVCVFVGYLLLEDETPFSLGRTNVLYENQHYDIFKPLYFSSADGQSDVNERIS
ncbi:MAG: zinc-ribbon domain-containing protein [Holosporales bacterium]|nr:zinc-ribbon domain-containing protein [Holosporales bacterium]